MKRTRLMVALTSLPAAAGLFLANATAYSYSVGDTRVVVYPALFFALVGAVQLVRYAWR